MVPFLVGDVARDCAHVGSTDGECGVAELPGEFALADFVPHPF